MSQRKKPEPRQESLGRFKCTEDLELTGPVLFDLRPFGGTANGVGYLDTSSPTTAGSYANDSASPTSTNIADFSTTLSSTEYGFMGLFFTIGPTSPPQSDTFNFTIKFADGSPVGSRGQHQVNVPGTASPTFRAQGRTITTSTYVTTSLTQQLSISAPIDALGYPRFDYYDGSSMTTDFISNPTYRVSPSIQVYMSMENYSTVMDTATCFAGWQSPTRLNFDTAKTYNSHRFEY